MAEDLCGHIIRTLHYIWTCTCPRVDHPLAYGGALSHYMVPTPSDAAP